MKCEISWIDENGKPTPDENEAVMMAHFHKPIWDDIGAVNAKIISYSPEILKSFPICAKHCDMAKDSWVFPRGGWSFSIADLIRAKETS